MPLNDKNSRMRMGGAVRVQRWVTLKVKWHQSHLIPAKPKNYFSQFGTVTECEMPFDKTKNQRKNFCFITFEREETMKDLLKSPKQKIGEVEVDVKRATPKSGKYFLSFLELPMDGFL